MKSLFQYDLSYFLSKDTQFQGKGSQQQTVTDSSTVTDTETQPSDFSLKRKN